MTKYVAPMDSAWPEQRPPWGTRPVRPLTRRDAIILLEAGMRYRFGVPDLEAMPADRESGQSPRMSVG